MNPNLDRQDRAHLWPHPNDTAVDRARKVAGMYRQHLHTLNPAVCDQLDQVAAGFGQTWMLDKLDTGPAEDHDLTTEEAAELVEVSPETIRKWACMPHRAEPGRTLLPRFGRRNRQRTYLAQHVREAAAIMRTSRRAGTAG